MNKLSRIIADEIRQGGPVSASRFMALALYCPVYGYYERDADSVGRGGDFQTSVSVGSLFGELFATRVAGWLGQLRQHGMGNLHLVEAGAHDGRLALDILSWLRHQCPELLKTLQYYILEPSKARQAWQREKLNDCLEWIRWLSSFDELKQATGGVCGVIFSNEVLDALPLHRFAWDASQRAWFEWRVDEKNDRFFWSRGGAPEEPDRAVIDHMVPRELHDVLPDGYVFEYSPAAVQWWCDAANNLERGWLVTFDYGFDERTEVLPGRVNGTLRGYRRHQAVSDVLANPGEQDITAHVYFRQIRSAGEARGMQTEFFGEQGRFLVQLMQESTQFGRKPIVSDPGQVRQFKTLIHPDHFGRSFKALVQSRLQ